MSFNDFIQKQNLKHKATSTIKIYEVLKNIGPDLKVQIYLGDGPFSSDIGIVNLHPTKGTHWVCYINEKYFVSNGCAPPQKLSKFFIKRNGYCLYSEYRKRSNRQTRLLLFKFLFVNTSFDKSHRNEF